MNEILNSLRLLFEAIGTEDAMCLVSLAGYALVAFALHRHNAKENGNNDE